MAAKVLGMGWGFGGFDCSFWVVDELGSFRSPLMVLSGELLAWVRKRYLRPLAFFTIPPKGNSIRNDGLAKFNQLKGKFSK